MEKRAYFCDKFGNKLTAIIEIRENYFAIINVYNEDNVNVGYANLFFHPNKRLFLDSIYCYSSYRNLGIASKILALIDYLFEGYLVKGAFNPYEASNDYIINDKKVLKSVARIFYEKNGYQIVEYAFFKSGFDLEEEDFFIEGFLIPRIVFKKILKKEHQFFLADGEIYHDELKAKMKNINGG